MAMTPTSAECLHRTDFSIYVTVGLRVDSDVSLHLLQTRTILHIHPPKEYEMLTISNVLIGITAMCNSGSGRSIEQGCHADPAGA
jgi:hypothetical protein